MMEGQLVYLLIINVCNWSKDITSSKCLAIFISSILFVPQICRILPSCFLLYYFHDLVFVCTQQCR
jgi:hypothetical protein